MTEEELNEAWQKTPLAHYGWIYRAAWKAGARWGLSQKAYCYECIHCEFNPVGGSWCERKNSPTGVYDKSCEHFKAKEKIR